MAINKAKISFLKNDIRKKIKKLLKDVERGVDYLYEIATTEEKTGLYNYRFFRSVLRLELEKVRRNSKKSFSLMIIDIDFFKKINDTYGHLVGDRVIIRFAGILKKGLRKYDIICRFGGEEFIVLMPNTPSDKALKASKRLRNKVLSDNLLKKYKLTFSAGISSYKKKDALSSIKKRADKALYKAKRKGRNRTEVL